MASHAYLSLRASADLWSNHAPEFDEDGLNRHQTFNASDIFLRDLSFHGRPEPKLLYEYDFGDCWRHWISFQDQLAETPGQSYPLILDGARGAPPEDCGGPPGYERFLKAWRDPKHEKHKAMRTWAGRAFDPEAFDRDHIRLAVLVKDLGDLESRPQRPAQSAGAAAKLSRSNGLIVLLIISVATCA